MHCGRCRGLMTAGSFSRHGPLWQGRAIPQTEPAVSASAMGHDPPSRSFRRPEQTGSVIVELPEGRAEVL
jgi:hypothetical protein